MKFQISDEQKRALIQAVLTAVVTLVLAVASIFGYDVVMTALYGSPPIQDEIDAAATGQTGIVCKTGTNCVDIRYGKDIAVFTDNNPSGTPSFKVVGSSGAVSANTGAFATSVSIKETPVVAYATPAASGGLYRACGQTVITGTGTIAHGLATPSYVNYGLAQDATGDGARLSHTNVTSTVTIKVWNSALTPVAAATPATVDWCVFGTK